VEIYGRVRRAVLVEGRSQRSVARVDRFITQADRSHDGSRNQQRASLAVGIHAGHGRRTNSEMSISAAANMASHARIGDAVP